MCSHYDDELRERLEETIDIPLLSSLGLRLPLRIESTTGSLPHELMELQLHTFEASKDALTFIPYGLKSELCKEAVKVHVLHGRKRAKMQRNIGSRPQETSVQGQMFHWDSRAECVQSQLPLQRRRGKDVASHGEPDGRQVGASASTPHWIRVRPKPHIYQQGLSLDDHLLQNPFTALLRSDYGFVSHVLVDAANFLVDHYLSRCGHSLFPRELLACYWQDAASFKAFLAHAATLFSLETGLRPPLDIEELMCGALREISKRISNPKQSEINGTVLAITFLANVEEGRGQRENAEWHWRGLKRLLRQQGDFSLLLSHRELHTMLLWREILTSNSYYLCLGHGFDDRPELQYCNEHLVSFFNGFADFVSVDGPSRWTDDGIECFLATILQRHSLRQCEWTSSMQRRSEIACLIYLAMLAVSVKASAESRTMMEQIKQEVVERDKWGPVNQDELLFIMLNQGDLEKTWKTQQLYQLSRCIYLTRKLDTKDWKTVRDMLRLFLGVQEGCDGRLEVLHAWKVLSRRLLIEDECCGKCHVTGWEGLAS